jgi:hypothetical protein
MLSLALHQDESAFVFLSGVPKAKKKIEKLGLFSPDFSFDRSFLSQQSAKILLSEMLKDILELTPMKQQDVYLSFPGELAYVTVYDDVTQDSIKTIVDKDIWLTEQKFGSEMIASLDCQVKVMYKNNGLARITPIYFPKRIIELFKRICHENNCRLVGMGINVFNATEAAKKITRESDYCILSYEAGQYELVAVNDHKVTAYSRFTALRNDVLYIAKSGDVPEDLCDAIVKKDANVLNEFRIFLTGTSNSLEKIYELKEVQPDIVVLNPMNINSAYSKPTVKYNKKYDTVFSSALGALI